MRAASSHVLYGFTEDAPKYADDGGASTYPRMREVGPLLRWDIQIDADGTIVDIPFLRRSYPKAIAAGMTLIYVVHSTRAADHDPQTFCPRVVDLLREFPPFAVSIWKEPNTRVEWTPQKDEAGNPVSPAAYWDLLKFCSSLVRQAMPNVYIVAGTLSPRASTSESTAPIPFVRAMAAHARATGIDEQVFDIFGQNVYPNPNSPTDGPEVGYADTNNVGIPNLDRLKRALHEGFNGTKQPTTVGCRSRALSGRSLTLPSGCVKILVGEWAWQVDTSTLPGYFGDENVKVVDEATQADFVYRTITGYFNCDDDVWGSLYFHEKDERLRGARDESGAAVGGGWNSGFSDINGRLRPVHERAKQAIADGCKGQRTSFNPGTPAQGSDAAFFTQKDKLDSKIDQLKAKVKAALKAKKVSAKLAKKYQQTLARLDKSVENARTPKQLKPIEKTLKRIEAALKRASKRR
jgi:hypothetical protein